MSWSVWSPRLIRKSLGQGIKSVRLGWAFFFSVQVVQSWSTCITLWILGLSVLFEGLAICFQMLGTNLEFCLFLFDIKPFISLRQCLLKWLTVKSLIFPIFCLFTLWIQMICTQISLWSTQEAKKIGALIWNYRYFRFFMYLSVLL